MLPIFACLFSCAPPVVVSVEAQTKSAPAAGTQVVLIPFDPRVPASEPTYAYLVTLVSRALAAKGLQPTPSAGEGHAVVAIDWRRDPPKVTTRVLAAGMQSPGFRSAPRGTPQDVRGGIDGGEPFDSGNPLILSPGDSQAQKTARYPWTIVLRGLDPAAISSAPPWTVTASGDSPSEDPADIAPQVIAASWPFIGTNTARRDVRISAGDAAVKTILADSPKGQKPN
jgi:hypothetical protein